MSIALTLILRLTAQGRGTKKDPGAAKWRLAIAGNPGTTVMADETLIPGTKPGDSFLGAISISETGFCSLIAKVPDPVTVK